jgi:HAMP domain-containing protein
MRLNIAPKLFLGFVIVIFLNVFFLVIISKLEDVNSSARILKKQNELKSDLLRLKTLHRVQGPSVISYERIGRIESAKNFEEMNKKIVQTLDSIKIKFDSINSIDSNITLKTKFSSTQHVLQQLYKMAEDVRLFNNIYKNMFDSIVGAQTSLATNKSPRNNLKKHDDKSAIWRRVLNENDMKITTTIDSAESIVDEQTNVRIKEIEARVNNIQQMTLFIIAGVTVFAILFGFFFSRAMTNSLRRLKESASIIGKGNFDFDPSGYPNDEIGDLSTAFFQMSLDLKNTQEELIKSKRLAAIGEVIASVNHEINNPLMIISGNAQFLEMMMEGYPEEMKERVKTILEETDRISKVTRKLREIKNPVVEDYTSSGEQMINLDKSSE